MNSKTKTCKDCQVNKKLDSFYTHNQTADGYLNKCKDCVKSRINKYRWKNIDKIREYDRNRPNALERSREYNRRIKEDIDRYIQIKNWKRDWDKKNKQKKDAHKLVSVALKKGELIKPDFCSVCANSERIEGHHDDYSKPLEVRWLCHICHRQYHKNERVKTRVQKKL